eukprot:Hpha_TRINITY_DN16493_c6_g1::TRINITY_DN16493_c6_g1_i1::g.159836::m.159836
MSPHEETRKDPNDGKELTRGGFVEKYGGANGARLWVAAQILPPEENEAAAEVQGGGDAAWEEAAGGTSEDELARRLHFAVAHAVEDATRASAIAQCLWDRVEDVAQLLSDDHTLRLAIIDAGDVLDAEARPAEDDEPALRGRAVRAAEEKRVDPADGQEYTQEEFQAEYGGLDEWEAAKPKETVAKPRRERVRKVRQEAEVKVGTLENIVSAEDAAVGNKWLASLEWPEEHPVRETGLGLNYEFLDHTADVILHSWARSKKECWELLVLAMFAYMVNDGEKTLEDAVGLGEIVDVCVEATDEDWLLMKYMQEFLFHFADPDRKVVLREVRIVGLDLESTPMRVAARGYGELYRPKGPDRHPKGTDVKAITLELMRHHPPGQDESEKVPADHWGSYCIVDI